MGREITVSSSSPNSTPLYAKESQVILVFQLSDQIVGLPAHEVERIVPMAELARPVGLPYALEGILNLGGIAIPVLRLDRLFELPPQHVGLYSLLLVLHSRPGGKIAILADRVQEIVSFSTTALLPIQPESSFNACGVATVMMKGQTVHVLSLDRLLLAQEVDALSGFQAMAKRRFNKWEETPS
jgi:purine-binding chemotaxis protein CheW